MKKSLLYFFTIVLFASCKKSEILTKEEVTAVISRFDEGWKNKNPKIVDSVLSASYVYFTQSGGTFERNNVVKTAASPEYKLNDMSRRQYEIKIEGNTAVVNTIWKATGVYYGKNFSDEQRCSITLIKRNGKVEILTEHCTPIKPG